MKKRLFAALMACSVIGSVSVPAVNAASFSIDDADINAIEMEENEKQASFEFNAEDVEGETTKGEVYSTKDLKYDKASGLYYYIATANDEAKTKYAIVHGNSKVKKSNPNTTLKTLTIPSKIEGVNVVKIGDWGFNYYTAVTKVIMPDTITDIGIGAFEGCYSLSTIQFSQNLYHISTAAFEDCVSLKKANLPDSLYSYYSDIFTGCTSLTTIHIPSGLDFVPSKCYFKGTPNLTTFTFSNYINMNAYLKKEDYQGINGKLDTSELYIPPTVTSITVDGGTLTTNKKYSYDGSELTKDFIVACVKDSYAHKWAKKNGIKYDLIDPSTIDTQYQNISWNASGGDVDLNGTIDALDASAVLTAYAKTAIGQKTGFTSKQSKAADVNADGAIDALDASAILGYYAYKATGGKNSLPMFLLSNK